MRASARGTHAALRRSVQADRRTPGIGAKIPPRLSARSHARNSARGSRSPSRARERQSGARPRTSAVGSGESQREYEASPVRARWWGLQGARHSGRAAEWAAARTAPGRGRPRARAPGARGAPVPWRPRNTLLCRELRCAGRRGAPPVGAPCRHDRAGAGAGRRLPRTRAAGRSRLAPGAARVSREAHTGCGHHAAAPRLASRRDRTLHVIGSGARWPALNAPRARPRLHSSSVWLAERSQASARAGSPEPRCPADVEGSGPDRAPVAGAASRCRDRSWIAWR